MTETATSPVAPTNADRFSPAYCEANRIVASDNDIVDGRGNELEWFVLIETEVAGQLEGKACACGCQQAVTNTKRNFLPGHDQRLMGILVRAERENLQVSWSAGGMTIGGTAMDYGQLVLGETGVEKLKRYLATEPKRARKGRAAKPAKETPIGPVKVADVKVGRWEYPAQRLQDGTIQRNLRRDGSGPWVAV